MASQRTYFGDLWAELNRPEPVLRHAYLLYGPEEYLTRRALDRIAELCGPVRPLDFAELSGAEVTLADVADEVMTLPMVASRRLVVVRQAERLLAKAHKAGTLTPEADAFRRALLAGGSACLVCVASPSVSLASIPGGPLLKAFACYGSYPMQERQLVQWVQREARKRGLVMEGDVVARLLTVCGSSLLDLEHELDKLAAYMGGGEVTRAIVDEVVDASAGSLADLLEAVAAREVAPALRALQAVLLVPRLAHRVLPALSSMFEEVRLAVTLPREKLAEAFPAWKLREVTAKSRGWSPEEVLAALDGLFDAEVALKSGGSGVDVALTRFIVSLRPGGTSPRGEGMVR